VGVFLGILIGGIAYGSSQVFNPLLASVLVIIAIYYFTGINHIDGLADFGDGVAAHGTREQKIGAMRDTAIGTGGIIFCMIALIGIFSSIVSIIEKKDWLPHFLPFSLIVAETCAKQSMVTVAAFGKTLHKGFGSMAIDNTKKSDLIIGIAFTTGVSYLLLGVFGIFIVIISQLAALLVLYTANRHFAGVSGDVVGASNEIGRLAALFFIAGAAWMQF
jgi:adenosylcobinamide-GDP ribazoletransferase